jgi:hypothetical protein
VEKGHFLCEETSLKKYCLYEFVWYDDSSYLTEQNFREVFFSTNLRGNPYLLEHRDAFLNVVSVK